MKQAILSSLLLSVVLTTPVLAGVTVRVSSPSPSVRVSSPPPVSRPVVNVAKPATPRPVTTVKSTSTTKTPSYSNSSSVQNLNNSQNTRTQLAATTAASSTVKPKPRSRSNDDSICIESEFSFGELESVDDVSCSQRDSYHCQAVNRNTIICSRGD